MLPQTSILHYPVHPVSLAEGLQEIESAIAQKRNLHVITLNPEMLMQAEKDGNLQSIVKSAEMVIPDGAGVVWALKRKGYASIKRLPGIELSERLIALAAEKNYKIALIGAVEPVLQQTCRNLQQKYPKLSIVYTHNGYFESSKIERRIAETCAAMAPHIAFIALGVPKQEKWVREYRDLFPGTIFVGVGGSFDVWSGLKRRAPDFFLKFNLEWLYRITSEPWRIKRTYKILPLFVVKVLFSGK